MIDFSCAKCGKQFNLKPEFAGRTTTCSGCKQALIVPTPVAQAPGSPMVAQASGSPKDKIAFSCAKCGMKFNVPPTFAGRKTPCPTCKTALVVPTLDQTAALVPTAGRIDGPSSSLAQAQVDADVTLAGNAGTAGLPGLMGAGARYIIDKELARGGMGAVLRAIDCDIRREVAVKYLLDQTNAKNKIRFVEEAQITGQLEHPNIVPIHELGVDAQKRIFFTMKMVKGRSIAQVVTMLRDQPGVAEKEYTLSRLLNIFVSICNALAYAHSRGVVHRDLKPANVMVGDFGEVYVMDWGLAKVLGRPSSAMSVADDMTIPEAQLADVPSATLATSLGSGNVVTSREADADLTQAGAIMGTPVYMPPEQAAGRIDEIDERSDIYSMGAILYELLTLQAPIDKTGGFWPIVMRVGQGKIDAPEKKSPERALAGKIPPELAAIAMKALAKEKRDRYQTIESLRKDIERFTEGRSVSAKVDTIREMAVKLVKRNKGVSIATAAATVILAVVGIWSLIAILSANARTRKTYESYLAEQSAKREQAKTSVPSLVRAARMLINENQLDDAFTQVNTAVGFDADAVDPRLMRAQLLCGRADYAAAQADLETCVKLIPGRTECSKLLDVVRTSRADNTETLLALAEELSRQKAHAAAAQITRNIEKLLGPRKEMLAHYQARIEAAWPGLGGALTCDATGEFRLNLGGRGEIQDISPLRGFPLSILELHGCGKIDDLRPLKGMPLKFLNLLECGKIEDLAPLQGMPLTNLNVAGCVKITDLSSLKGMPLKELNLHGCAGISDLTPLKGMPLQSLTISDSPMKDIEALRGLPLIKLNIYHCLSITSLAPLKGMQLTELSLNRVDNITDVTPLQNMPLVSLDLTGCGKITDFTPLSTLALKTLDLRGCSLMANLTPLKAMRLTDLNLGGCDKISDLMSLKGMPLAKLVLRECRNVTDLSPLIGMPLTNLDFYNTGIADLTPLQGMPLNSLSFAGCIKVTDLAPLKGMPLTNLNFSGCDKVTDLASLKGMPLQSLVIAGSRVKSIEPLRGMPLAVFTIEGNDELTDLTPIKEMKLSQLELKNCTKLSDLAPLAGMKFGNLFLTGSAVRDLAPLQGMPIQILILHDCKELHDLTPLARLTLVHIVLPPRVTKGIEGIRAMKSLTHIDNLSVNEFWIRWDATKAK